MRSKKAKRSYSLLIIITMVAGTLAGAFAYYRSLQPPQCEPDYPDAPVLSRAFSTSYNNIPFNAVNVTFFKEGQVVVLGGVTFRTLLYFDPSQPHLVGRTCLQDASTPISLVLEVTFHPDESVEQLGLQYGGVPVRNPTPSFTSHTSPQAGVGWYSNDPYVVLMASP